MFCFHRSKKWQTICICAALCSSLRAEVATKSDAGKASSVRSQTEPKTHWEQKLRANLRKIGSYSTEVIDHINQRFDGSKLNGPEPSAPTPQNLADALTNAVTYCSGLLPKGLPPQLCTLVPGIILALIIYRLQCASRANRRMDDYPLPGGNRRR